MHPGDHVWWDRHDWSQTEHVPAVVGSFPEPFLHGIDGKRLPVRSNASRVAGSACRTVIARLRAAGVTAAYRGAGSVAGPHTLRVIVGAVAGGRARRRRAGDRRRPAREWGLRAVRRDGTQSRCSTATARPSRTLGAGAGLVAATRQAKTRLCWSSRAPTRAGLALAAAGFDARTLDDRFAVALAPRAAFRPQAEHDRAACREPLFYRRLASPLHATRAGVGAACGRCALRGLRC